MKLGKRTRRKEYIVWATILLLTLIIVAWKPIKSISSGEHLSASDPQSWLGVIGCGLLSFSISKLLTFSHPEGKRLYRVAILFSTGLILLLIAFPSWVNSSPIPFGLLILAIFSSFTGSFVSSNIALGWWENNAQPTARIAQEVYEAHQASIFPLPKTDFFKRLFDIAAALISLILSLPIWLILVIIIWWEDPGPVLFVKNSVGRGGINFKQLKFRSMIMNAEKETGPISGYENDERVLPIGEFLRKTALDELPQLINIFVGDMSYVGPRPQRTVLVHGYLQEMPEYAGRHRVRPGLAGLAQVADSYNITPREKLAWDLVYIENATLLTDIKLLLAAFLLVFGLRWNREIDPELAIRRLLKVQKPVHPPSQDPTQSEKESHFSDKGT